MLTKKEIKQLEKIKEIKGEIRGLALKNYGKYILRENGAEGLKKLEEEMREFNCPIKYQKIQAMGFYPLWWSIATFVAIRKLFHYDEKKFQEMGRFCFRFPNIIRIWSKYLISIKRAAKSGPQMFRMYFTVGDFTVPKYNEREKYAVLRLENYPPYPIDSPQIYCCYLTGYFSSIVQIITGKPTTGKEVKCLYKGDDYHEFLITW